MTDRMEPIENASDPKVQFETIIKGNDKLSKGMEDLVVELEIHRRKASDNDYITKFFIIIVSLSVLGIIVAVGTMYINSNKEMEQACLTNNAQYTSNQIDILKVKNPELK